MSAKRFVSTKSHREKTSETSRIMQKTKGRPLCLTCTFASKIIGVVRDSKQRKSASPTIGKPG